MTDKPEVLSRTIIARTRIFCVEAVDLRFSNGEERTFERLVAGRQGAVMVVPVTSDGELLLIREYAAGTDRYELAFPKGLMEEGESPEEAANRELKEEVGMGARRITPLKSMTLAPGYLTHKMHLLLAEDLYPESLPGDEPEPMIVEPWPIADWQRLLERDDFTEARSVAALFLVRNHLQMPRP
jgi:ADP-ribose diphosphatase